MRTYQGKGAYSAVAVGRISLFRRESPVTECVPVTDTEREKARFERAKMLAVRQLKTLQEETLARAGAAGAAVFEAHQVMLADEDYSNTILRMIEEKGINAEYAVAAASDRFAELFSAMDDEYMKARGEDVRDISRRLIRNLAGTDSTGMDFTGKVILCASDLSPSETAALDREKILAFVTARGSLYSHTAILARSMNIPAVIGAGDRFLEEVEDGEEAAVDGGTGRIYVDPDREILADFLEKQRREEEEKRQLQELKGKENRTLDGRTIEIYANIGDIRDVGEALANDAGGIGLFRSEFLYLEDTDYPTEEKQFAAYRKVLESMAGKKVIIRTLDIGADKKAGYFHLKKEENPALGCRGIRVCLLRPEIFRTQLRALYRASVYGDLGIMFPMLTSVAELEKILEICSQVREELKEQGIPYSEEVELGVMIETPAAALISHRLAPLVDFFSVGTNDLTQYTLACDRQNAEMEQFVDTHHEAVLRLIEMSVENAHRYGAWIGICGELGADTSLTEMFLRMGIDELSVPPPLVLKLRDTVRHIDLQGARS